jgi:hypothetical protein
VILAFEPLIETVKEQQHEIDELRPRTARSLSSSMCHRIAVSNRAGPQQLTSITLHGSASKF